MDEFKDFFKELRDRASNPLLASFIISWLIINWRIPIALIFYDKSMLLAEGYKSYAHLIFSLYSTWRMVWLPLLIALAYTSLFPLIKSAIKWWNAHNKAKTESYILTSTNTSVVSLERYIEMIDENETKQKMLSNLIAKQTEIRDHLDTTLLSLSETDNHLSETKEELSKLKQQQKIMKSISQDILNGTWEVTTTDSISGEKDVKKWVIKDGGIEVNDKEYFIRKFIVNPFSFQLFIEMKIIKQGMFDESSKQSISLVANTDFSQMTNFGDDVRVSHIHFQKI